MTRKSDTPDGKKAANKGKRDARGAFLPGNKEGVSGRPKGSRNITTRLIENLLEGEAEGSDARADCLREKGLRSAFANCVRSHRPTAQGPPC